MLEANLLPAELRSSNSRIILVPTVALASILLVAGRDSGGPGTYEERRATRVARSRDRPLRAAGRESGRRSRRRLELARSRVQVLDRFHRRTRADLDALQEITRLLEPPAWLNGLEMDRRHGDDRRAVRAGGAAAEVARQLAVFSRTRSSSARSARRTRTKSSGFACDGRSPAMKLTTRDRRALLALGAVVSSFLSSRWWFRRGEAPSTPSPIRWHPPRGAGTGEAGGLGAAGQGSRPGGGFAGELAEREKGVIQAETLPQAQAQLMQVVRRIPAAQAPPIEIRSVEVGQARPLGDDYGEISVPMSFECRIEQLVNLLADDSRNRNWWRAADCASRRRIRRRRPSTYD